MKYPFLYERKPKFIATLVYLFLFNSNSNLSYGYIAVFQQSHFYESLMKDHFVIYTFHCELIIRNVFFNVLLYGIEVE